jgi:hypothetical protein
MRHDERHMPCPAASLSSRMRAVTLVLLATLVLAAGCGSHPRAKAKAPPPVRLHVASPSDETSTREATVAVSGSVAPRDAAVRVLGRPADVVSGSFTARVPLRPGANVIDLLATARGRGPALTALRVTRVMPIRVPDLTHLTPSQARTRVRSLGLQLRTQYGGGLLEGILPGTPGVCEQDPAPGTKVQRGAQVLVLVAKHC